jgi:hypothetical protein
MEKTVSRNCSEKNKLSIPPEGGQSQELEQLTAKRFKTLPGTEGKVSLHSIQKTTLSSFPETKKLKFPRKCPNLPLKSNHSLNRISSMGVSTRDLRRECRLSESLNPRALSWTIALKDQAGI